MSERGDMARITAMQEALNRHLMTMAEWSEQYLPPPRTRRQKAAMRWRMTRLRAASRWRRARRAVALWIAPELEEDW